MGMKMEPQNTHEGQSPNTDDLNAATLAPDSDNDHASLSKERSDGGDNHSIEATSHYVLELEDGEGDEIKQTISHDGHNGSDHSGEESDAKEPRFSTAIGNDNTGNVEKVGFRSWTSIVELLCLYSGH